ncbi:MAG: (Fe-S)-binding protein [Thermodesulfovibrio sp.]|nr:(Fe-S)-binding protein [Thermodesulfovibrio sp.]
MDFIECNKCGKCRELCPSYRIFLNEAFSPRGRVQIFNLFKEGNIPETKPLKERIFSCLLCGACKINCPIQVNVPYLMYDAREKTHKNLCLLFFKYFSLYPKLFFSISTILNSFKPLKSLIIKQKLLPSIFLDKLSAFEKKSFDTYSLKIFNRIKPKGRIALFLGCSTTFLMPFISNAIIEVLSRANFEVIVPKQNCCGAPLLGAGYKKDAINLAIKNLQIYKSFKIDGVITPCPTCAHFIVSVYKELTGESINVLNLTDAIENIELTAIQAPNQKIFFHVSCHSSNYLKESDKILNLLKNLGFHIEKKEGCCGFAGLFSFLFEKSSMDILREKVLEYEKADMIISSCPNCIIQFKFAMQNKKIIHYTEFIRENFLKGDKNGRGKF